MLFKTIVSLIVATTMATPAISPEVVVKTITTEPPAEVIVEPSVESEPELIDELVNDVFGEDAPLMLKVAKCESSLTHSKDGEVIRGLVDNKDSGLFQINKRYHLKQAEKLGLDIDKLEHNIIYAKLLYDKEGLAPWSASKSCWQ